MRAGRAESILDAFSERGWVTITDGVAVLTPEGRAAHDDAFERIRKLRSSVADGISAEDYATTMATLETMARNLGWDGPKREADADAGADAGPDA
jgi:DNA-binding MarR family transcriptional regulator